MTVVSGQAGRDGFNFCGGFAHLFLLRFSSAIVARTSFRVRSPRSLRISSNGRKLQEQEIAVQDALRV
jgi:hypothetical protein